MTNEEAIEIIKSECYVFNPLNFDRSTMVDTALDMAVKALSVEPCEDCISRESAIRVFGDVHPMDYNTQVYITRIQYLPSVTPQIEPSEYKPFTIDELEDGDKKKLLRVFQDQNVLDSVMPEQEPCEDAISRKWLRNAIHNFYKGLIHTPTEEDIQAYIDVAPSVKPQYTEAEIQKMQEMEQAEIEKAYELGKAEQPKMGHWKRVSADKYVQHATYYYRCSECDNDIIGEHNYCPHCGAKMEVEE